MLVEKSGTPIAQQARHAFSRINLGQFSSGILLDLGSVLSTEDILSHDGQSTAGDPGMPASAFIDALGDLTQSTISPQATLPAPSTWRARVEHWRQIEELTPISIAVVNYERVVPDAYHDGRLTFDGQYFHEGSPGTPYSEQRTYVATSIPSPALYGPVAHCVIPSDLVVGVPASNIRNIQIQFDGQAPMPVTLDHGFDVHGLEAALDGSIRYTLSFEAATEGIPYHHFSAVGLLQLVMLPELYSMDVDPITASIPYEGVLGKMNVRLYSKRSNILPLHNPVVIVDGIDVLNNRTFNEIWSDFGETLQKFLDLDHDLVVCDYQNGRDYIQRNGYALRRVLATVPTWMDPSHQNDRIAVVAGSMGTQVARYALTTAESSGEDHHVGLFISIDGPYRGANIPIGLQGWVEFFASMKPTVQELLDGLNSPAASQLLLRNRWHNGIFTHIYQPRPAFTSYYAEANALGLPTKCRNVAVASGSGGGQRVDWRSVVTYLRAQLLVLNFGVNTTVNSDHNGMVLYAYIKKSLFSSYWWKWTLLKADYIDLAPGGLRNTPGTICSKWNESLFLGLFVPMTTQQQDHCFIPTASALNVSTDDLDYAPAFDAAIRQQSPFDGIYYAQPNTLHASETSGNLEYIVNELESFFGVREHLLVGDLVRPPTDGGDGGIGTASYHPVAGNSAYFWVQRAPVPLTLGDDAPSAPDTLSIKVAHDELLTINTHTRRAMVQERDGPGWKTLWSNDNGPFIGGWYINPGDKYFLADLVDGGEKELFCVSAAVPAWAMIQSFDGSTWVHKWNNGGLGMLGPWRLRTTDQYAFGARQAGFVKDTLLAAYRYQGHSSAQLLRYVAGNWEVKWSNGDNDMIGGFPVQLGNQYSYADLDGVSTDELFTVNLWTNPVGWVVVQRYDASQQLWSWVSSGSSSPLIGTAWARGPGDRYEFADSDGDGRDELHCFSGAALPWSAVFDFTPGANADWTLKWQNGGNGTLGAYALNEPYRAFSTDRLRPVDRFAWGKLVGGPGDEMLGIAPRYFGPAVEQSYQVSPPGWQLEWTDHGFAQIGAWTLYE